MTRTNSWIDSTTHRLTAPDPEKGVRGQYYAERTEKDLIVIHFTAGSNVAGAVNTWETTGDRVATAFIVGPDGKVFEVFPREFWAWHIGFNGGAIERRSIGIEIVNIGPLHTEDGKTLRNEYGYHYCDMTERSRYKKASFRERDYWATFSDEQYRSVSRLLDELCAQFAISRKITPAAVAGGVLPERRLATGIYTHTNFRRDKWDIGPAFEWTLIGAS